MTIATKSMTFAAVCLALFALASGNASAEERLFVGRVESVLLRPDGAAACPSLSGTTQSADGTTTVRMSNDCGCEESRIAVDESLLGSSEGGTVTTKRRLGEWCRPMLPLRSEAILVHVDGDRVSWSPLEAAGQDQLFETKRFSLIAGMPVGAAIPEVKSGFASLAALRRKLAAGR